MANIWALICTLLINFCLSSEVELPDTCCVYTSLVSWCGPKFSQCSILLSKVYLSKLTNQSMRPYNLCQLFIETHHDISHTALNPHCKLYYNCLADNALINNVQEEKGSSSNNSIHYGMPYEPLSINFSTNQWCLPNYCRSLLIIFVSQLCIEFSPVLFLIYRAISTVWILCTSKTLSNSSEFSKSSLSYIKVIRIHNPVSC